VTNTVGTGIRPQSRVRANVLGISADQAAEFQTKAESIFKKWCKHADAGKRLNFFKMQALVDRQIIENGEIFLVPVMLNKAKHNRPYSFAYQLIEADRVDTPFANRSSNNIRRGIEIGKYGEPKAYHISKGFPGDWKYYTYQKNHEYVRYSAVNPSTGYKNVLHLYDIKRPDQSRGYPLCTPVIEFFQHLDKYLEAEIISARISACFSIFVQKNNPAGAYEGINIQTDDDGRRIETINPGTIEYLEPGEEPKSFNPARPGQTFDQFTVAILRMIAAGCQLPYELVQKNFSKSNYSNMRACLLQAYKYFRTRQKYLGDELCTPTWERVIEEAYLLGELDAPNFYEMRDEWLRVAWIADGWEWVDPQRETKASVEGKKANIISFSDICASRGKDWEESLEQMAREKAKIKKLEKKYGVKFTEDEIREKLSETQSDDGDEEDEDE
jgi:lambda family phage portal protein